LAGGADNELWGCSESGSTNTRAPKLSHPCPRPTDLPTLPHPPAPRLQVQLLLGRLPSPALIAAHGLQQYEPIIAAMRSGDVKLFNDTMDAQQFRFIQEVRG
jgi:hypothetical protein